MESILHIIGIACLSTYLVKAYFESTLIVYLASFLAKKKMYTFEDYENYVVFNLPKFFTSLLLCRICLSFHISWLTTLLFKATGAEVPFLTAVGVAALSGAISGNFNNKVHAKEEKKDKLKEGLRVITSKQDNSNPKDVGGMLIDYSGDKPKFIGYTDFYKEHVEAVFDEAKDCTSKVCEKYRKRFKAELHTMKEGFKEKGEKCPECNISSLKRKFYDIIKDEYNKNGHIR